MGVGQSAELTGKLPGKGEPFVAENKEDIFKVIRALADTIDLSKRGCNDGADEEVVDTSELRDNSENIQLGEIPTATPRKFTEEEIRELFAPYEHLLLSNHYLGDSALTQKIMLPVIKSEEELFEEEQRRRAREERRKRKLRRESACRSALNLAKLEGGATSNDDEPPAVMVVEHPAEHDEDDEEEVEEQPEEIEVPVLDVVAGNPYLVTLDVGYNKFTHVAVKTLLDMIKSSGAEAYLRTLTLSGNPIGGSGCAELGAWLASDPSLEILNLFQCQLTDEDVVPLFEGIRTTNTHLRVLQIDWNFCTWRTLDVLKQTVQTNEHLAVVMMQSVPYHPFTFDVHAVDTDRVIEFGSTPAGYYRSGNGEPAEDAEESAAAPRWALRKTLLRVDLAGMHPLPHDLLQDLDDVLRPRREAYAQELADARAKALQAHVDEFMRDPDEDYVSEEEMDELDGLDASDILVPEDDLQESEAARAASERFNDSYCRYPEPPEVLRSYRESRRRNGGKGRRSKGSSYPGSLRRELPPIASEKRLRMAMEDARTFRMTLHGTINHIGEKIRPNGLDNVYMPPIHGGGVVDRNTLVHDMERRHLRACWCDNQDAAVPYSGVLHYHCKREGAIEYGTGKHSSSMKQSDGEDALPVLSTAGPYLACRGTGHRCVSASAQQVAAGASKHRAAAALAGIGKSSKADGGSSAGGRVKTADGESLFTTRAGVTMALHYNPVAYFTAPYQRSALIVDENNS